MTYTRNMIRLCSTPWTYKLSFVRIRLSSSFLSKSSLCALFLAALLGRSQIPYYQSICTYSRARFLLADDISIRSYRPGFTADGHEAPTFAPRKIYLPAAKSARLPLSLRFE